MHRRRIFWQIFPALLVTSLLVLLAVTQFATSMLRTFYYDRARENLLARARLIEDEVEPLRAAGDAAALDAFAKRVGKRADTRITIIGSDGTVLGETDRDPATMENHAHRPEVLEAASKGFGTSLRSSATESEPLIYGAIPVMHEGRQIGTLRAALKLTAVDRQLARTHVQMAVAGGAIAVLAVVISLWISLRLARPLEQLRRRAELFARGDLETPLPETTTEEISGLALAMRHMAHELNQRIRNEVRQRNEQQAVLSSMVEGVLAIDMNERVLDINSAASRLLGLEPTDAQGRAIQQVIRNHDLQKFIQRALASEQPIEGDIVLFGDAQRYLRANGTVLHDAESRAIGTVVVLHDMTRLRHLEQMRREFVANVSHELRTPITSIKGFAETMIETGAGDPAENERFLRIIARQADRLNAIIEDLLALARIEQDADHGEINRSQGSIREVLASAIQICAYKADSKKINLALECHEAIPAEFNAPLLEQSVVNLIDNAIKYCETGTTVVVRGEADDAVARIHVIDQGCGIEPRHLPRLFERFYRVDKARSRKLGGTGLGLAIVKHIAEAHKGTVTVESQIGKGSTFTITIPLAAPAARRETA